MSLYNTEILRGSLMPLESKLTAKLVIREPIATMWKPFIKADYKRMSEPVFDKRAPLVGSALRRWAIDCKPKYVLDSRSHHLSLRNPKTLYGVESAELAPGYSVSRADL